MSVIDTSAYNKFKTLPLAQYNIISYLMENNQTIFKLLKYPVADALDQPDLTMAEKGQLIWNGQIDSENYNIFFQRSTDDSFTTQNCKLHLYNSFLSPTNRTTATACFMFEIICFSKINQLNNYQTRIETMQQQILEALNGISIIDLGQLFFDMSKSRYDRAVSNITNNKNYIGNSFNMTVQSLG
jgi:hypothetical protein